MLLSTVAPSQSRIRMQTQASENMPVMYDTAQSYVEPLTYGCLGSKADIGPAALVDAY